MLAELKIENVAIIESAQIILSGGFNVLTGETGAGKSIILDAINTVLGERTSREILRSGADSASVTALFTDCGAQVARLLEDFEIDFDGEVLIRRRITADGRNICRVNGCPVTVSMLRTLGAALVNIHGQHDSQTLFSPENHVRYIDALADNAALRRSYSEAYHALRDAEKELSALQTDESEKARRLDMLRYQIEELENADASKLEVGSLDTENKKLTFAWKKGDRIAVYDNISSTPNLFTADADGAKTSFSGTVSVGATRFIAIYPDGSLHFDFDPDDMFTDHGICCDTDISGGEISVGLEG